MGNMYEFLKNFHLTGFYEGQSLMRWDKAS